MLIKILFRTLAELRFGNTHGSVVIKESYFLNTLFIFLTQFSGTLIPLLSLRRVFEVMWRYYSFVLRLHLF